MQVLERRVAVEAKKEGMKASSGKLTSELPTGGGTRSQAYLEGAMIGHTAAIKNEIAVQTDRIKGEHPNDPMGFSAQYQGWAKGFLDGLDPQLRPIAESHIASSGTIAGISLQESQRLIFEEQNKAETLTAAENLLKEAETSARMGGIDLAQARQDELFAMLDGALNQGWMTAAAVSKAKREAREGIDTQIVMHQFDRVQKQGVQSAVRFIQNLDQNESIDPEQRDRMVTALIGELSKDEKLEDASLLDDEDTRKARWRQGEQELTDLYLKGKLTPEILIEYNRRGAADPSIIRQFEQRANQPGPLYDDPVAVMEYTLQDLEDIEPGDIIMDQRLTFATRTKLISDRKGRVEEETGWRSTQNGQEAVRRITGKFKVIPGTIPTPETAQQVTNALTQLYNEIEALDPSQRELKAIEIAEKIIKSDRRADAVEDLERARARLEGLQFQTEQEVMEAYDKSNEGWWGGMGEATRDKHLKDIRRWTKKIQEAERVLNAP